MKESLRTLVAEINNKNRKKRMWLKLICVLCCATIFCTSYAMILPAISLGTDEGESGSDTTDTSFVSGVELLKSYEKVDGGDLSDTVHWIIEDVTDAFSVKTRQVRIYGEGEMPGSAPWKSYKDTLQKVVIEDGITNISSSAFSDMTKITTAELGNDITLIGSKAFYECVELSKINIPDSVREIGNYAFGAYNGMKLTSLKLNEGLETLGTFGNMMITSLYIPKTVTAINTDKFTFATDNCSRLTEIIVDEENTVYKSDPDHKSILTKDGTRLIRLLRKATGTYTIPDGVTTVGSKAISSCSISAVEFPDSVNSIEPGNFESCPNIRELNFPVLKKWAGNDYDNFLVINCNNLIRVTFKGFVDDYDYSKFANCSFYSCPSLKEVVFPDDVYEKVTTFGQRAFKATSVSGDFFAKFTNLTTLNNGNAYPVDNAAFSDCNSISKIVLGENFKKIQNGVFNNCLNVKEIVVNSKNLVPDFKTTSASTQSFQNLISCSKLTIGKTVDKLNANLMNAIFANDIKDVAFEGPNVLEIESGINAPSPIGELGGTYYADADGVLYKLDSDSNTATVTYFPTGYSAESYTVPATITADDVTYDVTQVGKAAFKDAKLKSVSFTNADAVSLSSDAFYDCANLESVNGVTDITAVKALFSSVGSGAFFGTKIAGDTEKNKGTAITDPLTVIKGDESSNFKISINATKFSFYTDETQTINVSVSNSSNSEDGIGRIYMQFGGSNYNLPATVGETLNNNGFEYTFQQSDIDGIYYYEFNKPASGETVGFSFLLSYPSPESAGGVVQVWSEIFSQEEVDALGKGVKFTEAGENYHEYEWKTVPRNITVKETVSSNGSLIGGGENDLKSYVDGMKFKVAADSSNTGRDDIGNALANDLIKSFDFTTTLTLPEGFQFDEDIKNAIKNGNYYCLNTVNNKGKVTNVNVMVTVDGKNFSLMTINSGAENLSIEYPDDNDKQLVIKYSTYNSSKTTEISDYSFDITYKQGLFYTNRAIVSGDTFTFDNKVDVVNNYTYSEPKESTATATATVTAGDPKLTITKSDAVTNYLSDKHNYKITVSNNTASTYTNFSYIQDTLPENLYIPSEDIQRMMLEEYGDRLSVRIYNAEFALNTSSIHGNTEKSVDGNDCNITNQNTGYDIPYNGASAEKTDVDIVTGEIKVYWKDGNLYAEYKYDEEYDANQVVTTEQIDTSDTDSLKNILDKFGFFVTKSTKYALKWDFSNDFVMYGGKSFDLNVYSKAMDTFMVLYYDNESTYINDKLVRGSNTAYAFYSHDNTDTKIATSNTTSNYNHYREIILKHAMFRDGETIDSNSGLADGDIIQQTAMFKHSGTGTYGALPLVNKISSNQLLLVRKDLNEGNAQLDSFETTTVNGIEYYVLKYDGTDKTLTNVYTGENQLAAKIELSLSGTLVHWYFDNLPATTYVESVDYLTMIDTSNESGVKWNINVESWLNDHQTHRLHLKSGADGISLSFDKKIVTNPAELGIDGYLDDNPLEADAFNTLKETQTLDTFSYIGEGNEVTYMLQLKSIGTRVTVNGSDIYDCMPWKYEWDKATNVTIKYVYEQGKVTVTNPDSWSITKDDPTTLAVEDGEYSYIVWDDDFAVELQGGEQLLMYVTLSFPTDSAWDSLAVDNNGATLYNRFYLLGVYREVSHELKLPVKARIQKGVYELGSVKRRADNDGEDLVALDRFTDIYKSDSTRQYYSNTD
ncbi:MAG: leucine-rich repeat protein, partial [Acutalibacteraceae bacterium]